jgi:hypothetical protein
VWVGTVQEEAVEKDVWQDVKTGVYGREIKDGQDGFSEMTEDRLKCTRQRGRVSKVSGR